MADLGTNFAIGDTLLLSAQTKDTSGTPTDADSLPTYQVYEQGGTTALTSGSFTKRDDTNTTGYYETSVTLSTANGFEYGKQYRVRKLATVSSQSGIAIDTFAFRRGTTAFSAIAGWPTLLDVQTRLDEMGLTAPGDDTIEATIAAAVEAWERMTRFTPFLGTGSDETRYLNPSGGIIVPFGGGITDEPTELWINGSFDDDSLYVNGTELVFQRDYRLLPANALSKGQPYTHFQLTRRHFVLRNYSSIKIVAPFGYAETVPSLAWESVMQEILVRLTPLLAIAESGGAEAIKQGPVEWKFGSGGGSFAFSANLMSSRAHQSALHYRRVQVY